MRNLTKFKISAFLGCSLVFGVIVGCSSSDSASDEYDNPFVDPEPIKKVDPDTGDSIVVHRDIDTVMHITENGETTYVADTIYVPEDTTLRWKGNSALRITEVSPLNLSWKDEDGDDGAWVEIYNAGSESASLKGYSLVENLKSPHKWVFGNEAIKAKSFRVVFCDKKDISEVKGGKDTNDVHVRTHTNWKMDKDSGTVYLIDPYNGIRDSVKYPYVEIGMSWGVVDGGLWRFFEKPTPEKVNTESEAFADVAPTVDLTTIKSGFYNEAITLNPPSPDGGVKIRCTLDGSVPTSSSEEFNKPITIDKNTSFRCASFKDGTVTKTVTTRSFFIGETVQMPVVSISVDPKFFTEHYVKTDCGDPRGCKDSVALYQEKEYPIYVEYFEKGSSSKDAAWGVNAGIDLMGGWSRLNKKKSVKISMREEYQDGRINYSLFETRKKENDKYKAFNLRNNGNRFVSDYIEDAMAGAILEGSGVDYQRSRQVVVFFNGEYYGIHDMREHYNEHYVEGNYGIDAGSVEMVKQLGGFGSITYNAGTDANYRAMLQFIGDSVFSGEKNENYAKVKTMMDVGNYADYMSAQIYYHNGDWPNNNVRAWRSPEQPWKFMVYDVDHGFGWQWGVNSGEFSDGTNMFSWIKKGGGNKPCKEKGCFANIYIKLIENPDFKRMFINRSAAMWKTNLNASNVRKVVNAMVGTIPSSEIERDMDKYHQNEKGYPYGFDKTGKTMTDWADERDPDVVKEYQEEFSLGSLVSMKLNVEGNGAVLMEGRNLGKSFSGEFFEGMEMELQAVPTDGSVFSSWSDGVTDNPRIVEVKEGATFTAKFK